METEAELLERLAAKYPTPCQCGHPVWLHGERVKTVPGKKKFGWSRVKLVTDGCWEDACPCVELRP